MPARSARLHAVALLGYVSVAVLFAWPLPLRLGSALLGAPGGDTGVYVWNLWVFRHEIVSHGAFPFFTTEILHATPPVPLTLHNYTPAANLVALPLLSVLGTVATFNLLVIASTALSAYAMFLLLQQQVGDPAAAWVGGVLYGFSPFMTARQMAHFSLVQAAALPLFVWLLHRIVADGPTWQRSAALGAVAAFAYLSDPYYAVYCALIGLFFTAWHVLGLERRPHRAPFGLRVALDVAILIVAAAVAAILSHGGHHRSRRAPAEHPWLVHADSHSDSAPGVPGVRGVLAAHLMGPAVACRLRPCRPRGSHGGDRTAGARPRGDGRAPR